MVARVQKRRKIESISTLSPRHAALARAELISGQESGQMLRLKSGGGGGYKQDEARCPESAQV